MPTFGEILDKNFTKNRVPAEKAELEGFETDSGRGAKGLTVKTVAPEDSERRWWQMQCSKYNRWESEPQSQAVGVFNSMKKSDGSMTVIRHEIVLPASDRGAARACCAVPAVHTQHLLHSTFELGAALATRLHQLSVHTGKPP